MSLMHIFVHVVLVLASGASVGWLLSVAGQLMSYQMGHRRLTLGQYYRLRRHGFIAIACFVVSTVLYFILPY